MSLSAGIDWWAIMIMEQNTFEGALHPLSGNIERLAKMPHFRVG